MAFTKDRQSLIDLWGSKEGATALVGTLQPIHGLHWFVPGSYFANAGLFVEKLHIVPFIDWDKMQYLASRCEKTFPSSGHFAFDSAPS